MKNQNGKIASGNLGKRQVVDRSLHSFVVLWISALLVKVPLSLALGLIALAGKWAWRGYGWVDEHIPAPPCPKRWSAEERIRRQNEEWNRKHNPAVEGRREPTTDPKKG